MVPLPIHCPGYALGAEHPGGPPEPVPGVLQRARGVPLGAPGGFARSHAALHARPPGPHAREADIGAPGTDAQGDTPRRSHSAAPADTGVENNEDTGPWPGSAADTVRARTAARPQPVPGAPGGPETAPAATRPPQEAPQVPRASAPGPDHGGTTGCASPARASPARPSAMPAASGNPVPGTAQPADITSAGHKAIPGAMAPTSGRGGDAAPGPAQMNGPARADGTHPAPGAQPGGKPGHDPERDLSGTARFPARLTAAQQGDRPPLLRRDLAQAAMAEDTGTGQLRPGRPASLHPDGAPHGHDPVRQAAPAIRTASAALPGAPVQAAGGFDAARFGAAVADMTARATADTLADDPEHRPPGSAAAPADPVRADSLRPDLARHAAGQVAAAIRAAGAMASASGPPGSFGIDLSPAELGRVRISMSVSDTGLVVAVQADRAETQDLLRRHIDHLRDMLADAGHASVRFDFGGGGRAWQGPAHPGPGMAPGSGVAAMPDAAQAALQRNAARTEGGLDMRL